MRYDDIGFRRRTRRRNGLFRVPDVWPLVRVAIVLLIVMMLGTAYPHHGWAVVDLVHSKYSRRMPGAVKDDAMLVSVRRDGRVYFGNAQIALGDLPEKVRESVRAGAEKRVHVLADSRAKYGDIREVMGELSLAGVQNVSFVTD